MVSDETKDKEYKGEIEDKNIKKASRELQVLNLKQTRWPEQLLQPKDPEKKEIKKVIATNK